MAWPSTPDASSPGRVGSLPPPRATVAERFLDAVYGGVDPGGVRETQSGRTIHEKDETLPVELRTRRWPTSARARRPVGGAGRFTAERK
jgi:N-acetylmuramoyl-L-alanine amidase